MVSTRIFLLNAVYSVEPGVVSEESVDVMHVTRKQTLRSLSLSYQKKDGRVWPCPSFLWYDADFFEFFDSIDHM